MKPRTLLILFVLVAALASFVWFVERDLPGSDERAEQAKKVLDFAEESLSRLEIVRDGARIVLSNAADGEESEWMLVEPVSARADTDTVQRLVDQLTGLEKERTIDDGDADLLGLRPPRAELVLESSGAERRLLIGGEIPASDSMIVATTEAGPFYVVEKPLWDEIERAPDEWRSRVVFPGERDEIDRLILEIGERRLILARRGEDFFIEAPLVDRADEGTVSRFIDALVGLQTVDFLGEAADLGDSFGLAPASGVVEVASGDGPAWRLELGDAADAAQSGETAHVYARAEGHVYSIADSLTDDLMRPVEQWRSLEWGSFEAYEIDRLDIRDADGPMVLEREGGDWSRDGAALEYSVASDLLYAISGTKAEALGAGEAISGAPLLSITVTAGEDEQILEVFPATGDRYGATASGRSVALWLGGDRIRSIQSSLAAVRAAESPDDQSLVDPAPESEAPVGETD